MGYLEILGIIFLLLLCVALYYGLKTYRWFEKTKQGSEELRRVLQVLPSVQLELYEEPLASWVNERAYDDDAQVLRDLGFFHDGCYEGASGNSAFTLSLWVNAKKGIYAALYETQTSVDGQGEPSSTYVADVFVLFTNNSTLTITTASKANALPRPKQHRCVYAEVNSVKDLFPHLKPNAPANVKIKSIGNPLHTFRDFCNDYHGWLWEEAQLRSPEIAALLAQSGIAMTDALIAELLEYAGYEKSEILKEKIIRRVARSSKVSVEQWESLRDQLVVVHDKMDGNQLVGCFYELIDKLSKDEEEMLEKIAERSHIHHPVALFSKKLKTLKGANRVKRFAVMREPVNAHVYVANPA